MTIKIVLADDHIIVRDGVKAVLERKGKDLSVVAEVGNGKELLEWASSNDADVDVVDMSMPLLNGVAAVKRVVKMNPSGSSLL